MRLQGSIRKGFTLLEMVVVISVILILASLSYPIMVRLKNQSDINGTKNLVTVISAAIRQYGATAVTDTGGAIHPMWTLDWGSPNTQQAIDGDPQLYATYAPSNVICTLAPPTYRGLVVMDSLAISQKQLDPVGRILDRWRQPLQIMWGASIYGTDGFGVWSMGPDKTTGDADDIKSWTNNE